MLEKPDFPDERIVACLQDDYGLRIVQIAFLPLGADANTAVYRAVAEDATPYFVKLRQGAFDEASVALPKFLAGQGLRQIIAPLASKKGQLWADLGAFRSILYPFVEGRDGYEVELSARHWHDLGTALKFLHTARVPPALRGSIPQETYSPQWRNSVLAYLARLDDGAFGDPVAVNLAALLQSKRNEILDLVARADRLAGVLAARSPEFVLCHSDVHAGNVLVDGGGALYIVDWDNPIQAPKERDLMFFGGGQGFGGHSAQEEETLFYRGYGPTDVDPSALAYYRYERIIQDIAAYCDQILLSNDGGEDRAQALHYVAANFLPNGTLALAYQADKT